MLNLIALDRDQVSRLTGLTPRQLSYWAKTGFFPTVDGVYTFRDLVGLRAIAQLRSRLPLQQLRCIGKWLNERFNDPWSSLTFYIVGRDVLFEHPEGGGDVLRAGDGQAALAVPMERIARETQSAIDDLFRRTKAEHGRVSQRRGVNRNRPVLAGTRIPTEAIRLFHEAGFSRDEIIEQYPRLTRADVDAAIRFERARRLKAG